MENVELRRQILQYLYEVHNRDPYEVISVEDLSNKFKLSSQKILGTVLYLSDPDKNLASVTRTSLQNGMTYSFVKITAAGMDLLDNPSEFNRQFPPQIIYQYVAGDNLEVVIGNNASNVIVGKDITSFGFGAGDSLENVLDAFLKSISEKPLVGSCDLKVVTGLIEELDRVLASECVDLGEVQRIKSALVQCGGEVMIGAVALFSHPSVVNPVMGSVENLVGRRA